MSNGNWSGISMTDMQKAAEGAAQSISMEASPDTETVNAIFKKWGKKYPAMVLELFSEKRGILTATSYQTKITDMGELISCLTYNGSRSQDNWVYATKVDLGKQETTYVIVIVPSKEYTAATFRLNGAKGYGLFGKMFLIGLGITLIITCSFAYLFTRKLSKRFHQLMKGIEDFDMENMDVKIQNPSKDEIGRLADTVNHMTARLREQVRVKQEYEEARRKLVSDISHDLRTPLTSIIGYSEALDDKLYENEEELCKSIAIIRRKAVYMEKLLKELLDFSRYETAGRNPDKQQTDITELARELLIEYLPLMEKEEIELTAEIPDKLPPIGIDRDMITRVIRNLLDNAIRYGKSGKKIEFMITDEKEYQQIRIRDYGPGIPKENIPHIFERFYRGDKSRATDGGMGLGLAIADEMVKLHCGKIEVACPEEKGTAFLVQLPKQVVYTK
jgi:Signal transduction histidine kinase